MPEKGTSDIYMKKYKKEIMVGAGLSLLFIPLTTLGVQIPNPLGDIDSIPKLVAALIEFIRMVALALAPLVFIFAGFKYFTAGGNPDQVKQATNLVKWALIGLAIILIAEGIAKVIADVLGIDPDKIVE